MRYAREKYAGRTYDGDSGIDYDEQSFPSVTDTSSSDVSEHLENGWNNILQCSGEPPHQFGLKIIRSVQWVVGLSHNETAKAKREVKGWKHIFYRDVKPLRSGKYDEQQMTSKPTSRSIEDEDPKKRIQSHNSMQQIFPKTIPIADKYGLKEKIGFGGFSTVVRAQSYKDGKYYAVKCIDVTSLSQKDSDHLSIEMSIMKTLRHANIMSLKDAFFNDPDRLFLVMPFVQGGDLFERLQKKGAYPENDAKIVFRSIIEAVKYCHDNGVIHRDIKPENVMLVDSKKDTQIVLCDFGCAGWTTDDGFLMTYCGTSSYMSPEMILEIPYKKSVDMWSCGVILYCVLSGYHPFNDPDPAVVKKRITAAEYKYHQKHWDHVSQEAKDLVSTMLKVNPSNRLSAGAALREKWTKKTEFLSPKFREEVF